MSKRRKPDWAEEEAAKLFGRWYDNCVSPVTMVELHDQGKLTNAIARDLRRAYRKGYETGYDACANGVQPQEGAKNA